MRIMPSKFLHAAVAAAATLVVAAPAHAQHFSDSYQFLEAIRKQDGTKAMQLISDTNGSILNTRDRSTGEAALHIVARLGDSTWLRYLIQKGANPNIQDGNGDTPMIVAVRSGYTEGVQILIVYRANVNLANGSGESPLIIAVQQRRSDIVRLLLEAGADPDQTDHISGQSARDYVRINTRTPAGIVKMINDAPKVNRTAVSGPKL